MNRPFLQNGKKFLRCLGKRPRRSPAVVQIEITNRCNLHCAMCPRLKMDLPLRDMAYETFEAMISNLPEVEVMILTGWGEPLYHPDFFHFVALTNRSLSKAEVRFTTNGLLLDAEHRAEIFHHRIGRINVSMEGLPKVLETENRRSKTGNKPPASSPQPQPIGHAHPAVAMENVAALIREREDRTYPSIWLHSVIQRHGLEELQSLIRWAGKVGVDGFNLFRLTVQHDPTLHRPDWEEEQRIIQEAKTLAKASGLQWFCMNAPTLILRAAGHFDRYCLRSDDYVYIDLEGYVTPCCNLRAYRCGNVLEQDLQTIWSNRRFEAFRTNPPEMCERCDALTYRQKVGAQRRCAPTGGQSPENLWTNFEDSHSS